MKSIATCLSIILILISVQGLQAAAPPANSPIALGQHPRIFFTASDLPALRDRIATYYQSEFQNFIDLLNDTGQLSSGQSNIENNWGSLNYAFLAVLDPPQMQQRGFTFAAALNTPQEYCDKSVAYAKTQLGAISSGGGQGHGDIHTGYPTPVSFPVIAAYDWCFPYLSSTDKAAIVDAFVSAFQTNYEGTDYLTVGGIGIMLANNQASADIHDVVGIAAFYNDPYPAASLQAEMYDAFYTVWIDRVLLELNYFYPQGTGWHEGPGGYLNQGFHNLGIPIAMFSSAMGTDYIATTPYFSAFPRFAAANIKPHSLLSECGSSGTARCPDYLERWGDIGGGISGMSCKTVMLSAGMLRNANYPSASLGKWLHEQATDDGCFDALTKYGGNWSNAVLYQFIYGDKEITAQSPSQLSIARTQRLGLGEYVMKTGYGSSDSQVVFWAMPFNMYGHDSQSFGQFSLHKYGNLILTAGNSKSGDAVLSSGKFNLLQNVIGIHKGSSDPELDFDGNVKEPFWGARGERQVKTAGTLLAESINTGSYDYIAYENSAAWDPSTADLSQREFVYLRGPLNREYVVVFDRMNVLNPLTDEKIWKIWVPAGPVFVNGSPTNPRTGKWTSTNTDMMSMTNVYSSLTTPKFESAPTHGKFYLKTLLPASVRINVLGGPGKEYQSGDDTGSTPWGAPSMNQGMHEYLGWGRIEVQPTVASNYDAFLNVIQFGDAATLTSMTPTSRITSISGNMVGADIQDTGGSRVVLFGSAMDGSGVTGAVTYGFSPASTSSEHLLVNMQPLTDYFISFASGSGSSTVTVDPSGGGSVVSSDSQGVLSFTLDGLSVVDTTPPPPPANLSVQ